MSRNKLLSIILVGLFVSGLALFFFPKKALFEALSFSKAIYSNKGELLRMTLSQDEKYRLWTPLSQMPKALIEATLLQEDRYFYKHYGVNPISLFKAFWQTYIAHSRRVGASTISMQLARLHYSLHSKSLGGKALQVLYALALERYYTKDEILEAYLNLAPYGGNIEGVGAASLIYFHKPVRALSLPEILSLSVIPQNPKKRGSKNEYLKNSRDHLFVRWLQEHPKDRSKQVLFDLPLVMFNRHSLPFSVPHLCDQILKARHEQKSLHTSLDLNAQGILERITRHYIARKAPYAVNNAAVLLVDTRDMRVKAMMGSLDFNNQAIKGQINGVDIQRSPGSTLKPFIYGLAIDQGLIHPNTVLKDVPQSFNGYNPENFDYDFMGPIKAKDALTLSRNVPAIYLSSQLQPGLHDFLERSGITHLKAQSYYGLSLSLGGAELTLKELLGLYAMLVNEGLFYPIQCLKSESKPVGVRLLSPEASYLVLDMLQKKSNADFPITFKTGTSSGYRDAWTLGSFGPYVLGVWLGNFDNQANPAFVGKDLALPLFLELVDALRQEWASIPACIKDPRLLNLKKIQVCRASGALPNRYCKDLEWTWFIPGKSPIKRDKIHREVAINPRTGLRTCHIDEKTRFEIVEFWPSDLLAIFKKAGIQRQTPPFFEQDCIGTYNGIHPQITSPQKGVHYVMRANEGQALKIPLSVVTDAGIGYVYWFLNDNFLAKVRANESFFWQAKPGHFTLRAVDDRGLTDGRYLHIELNEPIQTASSITKARPNLAKLAKCSGLKMSTVSKAP